MSLYMFRALNAHLCRMQSIHAVYVTVTLYESSWWPIGGTDRPPRTLVESDSTIYCVYTVYPTEDEHLRLETCRGT